MEFFLSAVAFLVIFSVIILIHEFGHFYVAKKSGIKVEEFGIGLPPRIWGKKFRGTIYSANWIPFGGFVKLYGEDSFNPAVLKNKQSFAGKPLRNRIAVVCAGVFMNFMLAIVLLTIGFSAGIEPLIVNSKDVFNAINSEVIEIQNDAVIKEIAIESPAFKAGLAAGDSVLAINDKPLIDISQLAILTQHVGQSDIKITYLRNGDVSDAVIKGIGEGPTNDVVPGITMFNAIYIPRVYIKSVKEDSESSTAGLLPGDVIYKMNSVPVYTVADYENLVRSGNIIDYEVIRDHRLASVTVDFSVLESVVITAVEINAPAHEAGFRAGDSILAINGTKIISPEDAVKYTQNNIGKEIIYTIERDNEEIQINVTPAESGRIGVGLISMFSYNKSQLTIYNSDYITSVMSINNVQYPFFQAVGQAFVESGRLAVLTVEMFGKLVRSVASQFAIPEGVAGPVGIARMTHVFAQEGLLALLRFTALLSLSLAVLNILPFPALDGGRLLFLLVEAVRGKRVPARWETMIHTVGFLLLIGLIFLVTYSDILNIFL